MALLIDKAALVAEIDRQKIGYNVDGKHSVEYDVTRKIIDVINSLEVKEVDLEKEITIYLGNNWKQDTPIEVQNDMISYAKHFFELGLKASLVKDFKKTMEE